MNHRRERDSLGDVAIPANRLYGIQTARAIANFPISGIGIGREMIQALGLIKAAAARVNRELNKLNPEIAAVIEQAALEVARGELDAHFPVDTFQTGSGTSSNMNANEVIANRAIQILGGEIGSKVPVHPNDHVNMGQSSNDVFPTAIHVAAVKAIEQQLIPVLDQLERSLAEKAREFDPIVKIGRTHLQDATPIRLGQEFSGFASQVNHGIVFLNDAMASLRELPIGGTAVGTGINTHREFGRRMAEQLSESCGTCFVEAPNHFEAQSARDAAIRASSALKALAISLIKIADTIRWLGSGPRLGFGELSLPATQDGSSIMPGKVNPVIAEALLQVGVQVIGNDAAISASGLFSHFQLNTMQPLIAHNLLEQIRLLANAARLFDEKLIRGLKANTEHIAARVEQSLAMATALVPYLGYDRATRIAEQAERTGKTIREIATEQHILSDAELDLTLDLKRQTEPEP